MVHFGQAISCHNDLIIPIHVIMRRGFVTNGFHNIRKVSIQQTKVPISFMPLNPSSSAQIHNLKCGGFCYQPHSQEKLASLALL